MKINFYKIQRFLDLFGLVLVASWTDEIRGFPKTFPYKMWVDSKKKYNLKNTK